MRTSFPETVLDSLPRNSANRLWQQLSERLVPGDPGGEDAGCGAFRGGRNDRSCRHGDCANTDLDRFVGNIGEKLGLSA